MSSTTSPRLVFGTYRLPDDAPVVFPVLSAARDTGFTMIDTAALYRNESIVRDFALDPAVRMEWGTKVHKIMFPGALRYKMESMVRKNKGRPMARLLLHRALPPHMWTELQEAHRDGLVGDIGVCNVNLKQLQTLCGNAATTGTQRPTVVQVECHPFLPDVDAVVALGQYCPSTWRCTRSWWAAVIVLRISPNGSAFASMTPSSSLFAGRGGRSRTPACA